MHMYVHTHTRTHVYMSELLSVPSLAVTLRTLSGPMIPTTAVYDPSACVPQNVGETYGCF